jgi:hypothetical protein
MPLYETIFARRGARQYDKTPRDGERGEGRTPPTPKKTAPRRRFGQPRHGL